MSYAKEVQETVRDIAEHMQRLRDEADLIVRKAKAFDWLEEALWNAWYRGHQPFRVDDGKRLILIECIRGEPKLLLAIEAERKR